MKKGSIILIGVMLLLGCSCASNRSTRAMRRAERMMERQAKESQREYEKAKAAHYDHQAPKTKKMMREDRRRARRLNRQLRRY